MNYKVILAEGADHVLGWRSPNFIYRPAGCLKLKLLLKNYRLSDDVAFRFSDRKWKEFPLVAGKYAHWIHQINNSGDVVNLFMDYETFGEHQWEEMGIFDFLRSFPREVLKHPDFRFQTPGEAAEEFEPVAQLSVPHYTSWADMERDLTAWLGNHMQNDAVTVLYSLEKKSGKRRIRRRSRRGEGFRRRTTCITCVQNGLLTELCTNTSILTIHLMTRTSIL